MAVDRFQLPGPYPEGAVFVGPEQWLPDSDFPETRWANAAAALSAWATEGAGGVGLPGLRLVVVHGGLFESSGGTEALIGWLEDISALGLGLMPVLVHDDLAAPDLVRCFRAGLFDAARVPVAAHEWLNILVRAERLGQQREQGRDLLARGEQTQSALRRQRRQLGREASGYADELLHAQSELEETNLRLTGAMSELSLLYRIGRKLGAARNWDDVLREILQKLARFVGAGGSALVLSSVHEGSFMPRQTWRWEEKAWDRVLVSLHDQVDGAIAESIMAPGVFRVDPEGADDGEGTSPRRIIALPLEHQDQRLGYLMLLFSDPGSRDACAARSLPFLQAVQVMLAEEVASAQMLDRIRSVGTFNARVLATVNSAIWVIDETGQTVFANRSAQTLLTGRAPVAGDQEDFLLRLGRGRRIRPLSPDLALPELLLDARLRLEDGDGPLLPYLRGRPDGVYRGEGHVLAADSGRIPVLVQTRLMSGRGRDGNWLVVVAEDLRESRQLEATRLRAERLEDLVEMSATLAHEIRNPLMGLSAQAELLAEQLPADDKRNGYLDVITREVGRIDDTISRMLNFVRPYEPDLYAVEPEILMEDAVELARPRAKAAGVELVAPSCDLDGEVLEADGSQLRQVLLNLLLNAVDAAGSGGRVTPSVRTGMVELSDAVQGTQRSVPGWVCEVRNTGPAIAPADLRRIFRPFFTTKSSGTGLGLSICHKIVDAHGGRITVARDGEETVFCTLLPTVPGSVHEEEA